MLKQMKRRAGDDECEKTIEEFIAEGYEIRSRGEGCLLLVKEGNPEKRLLVFCGSSKEKWELEVLFAGTFPQKFRTRYS